MSELRGQLRDWDALGDLHGRVAVPEVVRVEVRDPAIQSSPAQADYGCRSASASRTWRQNGAGASAICSGKLVVRVGDVFPKVKAEDVRAPALSAGIGDVAEDARELAQAVAPTLERPAAFTVEHYPQSQESLPLPKAILANLLGDFWGWIADVAGHIADVSVYWLILALALKTAESALIGLAWRNILRAAYTNSNLSFKIAWGASQGGTAINAVLPAQAGTVAMIGIFRTSIPGASVAGVTSATVVESFFFAAVSVVTILIVAIFLPRTVSKGSPSNEIGDFFAAHPVLIGVVVVAVILIVYFGWPRVKRRVVEEWSKAKQGAAIFRDRRRYAREVALPSALSYACRMGVTAVFMAAFDLPVTFFTVFLVASSHTLSQLFAITPGGVGQTQALDLVTLRRYASSENIAAFSVTQDSVITAWNIVLGVAVMLWAFGYTQTKAMLKRSGRKQAASEI